MKKLPDFVQATADLFEAEVVSPAEYKKEMRKKGGRWLKWSEIKPKDRLNPDWWRQRIGNIVEMHWMKINRGKNLKKTEWKYVVWTNKYPKPIWKKR